MMQSIDLILKTSIFHKESPLIITPEFIEYKNINLSKFEIDQLRYGIKAIRGYRFRIGRIYCIDIKSLTGSIMKIRLKSLYGIRKNRLEKKYKLILNALFQNFINDISGSLIAEFNKKIDFDILGVTFMQEGIILDKESKIISWLNL